MELFVNSFLNTHLTGIYPIVSIRCGIPAFSSTDREIRLSFWNSRWQFECFVPGKAWEIMGQSEIVNKTNFGTLLLPTVAKVWWVRRDGRLVEDERFVVTVIPEDPVISSKSQEISHSVKIISQPSPSQRQLDCMLTLYLGVSRAAIEELINALTEDIAWAVASPIEQFLRGSVFQEDTGISVSFQISPAGLKSATQISRDLVSQLEDSWSPLMKRSELLKEKCTAVKCHATGNPGPVESLSFANNSLCWKIPTADGCCSISCFWVEAEFLQTRDWRLLGKTSECNFLLEHVIMTQVVSLRVTAENVEHKVSEPASIRV